MYFKIYVRNIGNQVFFIIILGYTLLPTQVKADLLDPETRTRNP